MLKVGDKIYQWGIVDGLVKHTITKVISDLTYKIVSYEKEEFCVTIDNTYYFNNREQAISYGLEYIDKSIKHMEWLKNNLLGG